MCLAVPGKVVSIEGRSARIDYSGVQRKALIDLFPELKPGDFVLVHAGFVIQKLERQEAEEVLEQFREILATDETEGKP
jgi:hydrogenase expression/formation protein HypC